MRLSFDDGRPVRVGEALEIPADRRPQLCEFGMHASTRILDALRYSIGPMLCRVEVSDDIDDSCFDRSKFCGRRRAVLWAGRLTKRVLEDALHEVGVQQVSTALGMRSLSRRRHAYEDLVATLRYISIRRRRRIERFLRDWARTGGAPL